MEVVEVEVVMVEKKREALESSTFATSDYEYPGQHTLGCSSVETDLWKSVDYCLEAYDWRHHSKHKIYHLPTQTVESNRRNKEESFFEQHIELPCSPMLRLLCPGPSGAGHSIHVTCTVGCLRFDCGDTVLILAMAPFGEHHA